MGTSGGWLERKGENGTAVHCAHEAGNGIVGLTREARHQIGRKAGAQGARCMGVERRG